MMVNFYERNSETLYNYRMPEPHRSTIDYRRECEEAVPERQIP